MSFKYRQGGSWNTSTVYKRENDQWVAVSGGGNGGGSNGGSIAGSRFYIDGPPTRSGDIITYDGNSHSSLQSAYNSLEEDETLYIDPSNSPYSERLNLLENSTDHITIASDQELSVNTGSGYSVTTSGAEIQQPDQNEEYIIGTPSSSLSFRADASVIGSHSGGGTEGDGNTDDIGDTEISVDDASPFVGNEGEVIFIQENSVPFGEPSASGGSGHPDITHEFKFLEAVDTNNDVLTVHRPLYMPYPNNNSTSVGIVDDFPIRDIRISGLTLRADSSHGSSRPLKVYSLFEPWLDNLRIVSAGGNHSVAQSDTFRARYNNIAIEDADRYAVNINQGSTDTYITNIYGTDLGRYVVRFGAAGSGSRNEVGGLVEGIEGENMNDNPVCMSHWGGFYNRFSNVYVGPNTQVIRFRSQHLTVDDFTADGVGTTEFNHAQRPAHCVAKNGSVINRTSGDNETVFWFELDNEGSLHGNDRGDNLTYENIDIEGHPNYGIDEIGSFGENANIDGLTFRNITYDGQQLEQAHVEQWTNYDSTRIKNLAVE